MKKKTIISDIVFSTIIGIVVLGCTTNFTSTCNEKHIHLNYQAKKVNSGNMECHHRENEDGKDNHACFNPSNCEHCHCLCSYYSIPFFSSTILDNFERNVFKAQVFESIYTHFFFKICFKNEIWLRFYSPPFLKQFQNIRIFLQSFLI